MTMMKKRHILHWAMGVLMTPLLGSCTSDDIGSAGREECDIILGQPMTVTSATRATDGRTLSTQFEDGEEVWLWAIKEHTNNEHITAWRLKANGSGGFSSLTNGADKYWPSDGSSLDVYALHGNFKDSQISEGSKSWSSLSLTHTVEADQTLDNNKRLSDLLYSRTSSAVAPNNTVQLTFNHLLAKITVQLDLKNSNGINEGELANAEVTLTNILTTGIFKSSDVSTIITNGVSANTSGSREDIKAGIITQPSDMTSTDYEVGSAIVPLQQFGGEKNDASQNNVITITLSDNRSFSYKPTSSVALSAGKEYTYTLRIIGKKITGSLSVSEFSSEDKPISFKDYFDYLADLKTRAYLGSSGAPHDLSYDYNGQMNTANCYVVTHPGYYKLPLVYGNAIKNGATNAIAYGVGTNSTTFVNHLGKKITDPYIYNNLNNNSEKLEAYSAELVWQDAENLISNIGLSSDKHYIQFEITKENIEQGNAVIAVKDGSGKIMWSWHIWVTNKNVYETQAVTASYQGTTQTFMFMPFPLGWNDSTPAPTCTFYQWGRKDPFPPSNGSNSDEITLYAYKTANPTMKKEARTNIQTSIMNPLTFYGTGTASWENTSALDLWNVGNMAINMNFNLVTKSVYDPSPAGFHLPCTAAFTGFTQGTWSETTRGYTFTTNNVETYWQACGYRAYNGGSLFSVGSNGGYWSAGPNSNTGGCSLGFNSSSVYPQDSGYRANGYSVRPVSE